MEKKTSQRPSVQHLGPSSLALPSTHPLQKCAIVQILQPGLDCFKRARRLCALSRGKEEEGEEEGEEEEEGVFNISP